MNVVHFGASCDPAEKNLEFAKKLELDYPLLSDTDKKVAEAYGILGNGYSKRVTFIIGPDGKIAHIFNKVDVGKHGKEVAEKVESLKFKPIKRTESADD